MAKHFDRITSDPAHVNGKPCIRGMRPTVRRVVKAVVLYPDREELKREYQELDDGDICQALDYAAQSLDDEAILLGAAVTQLLLDQGLPRSTVEHLERRGIQAIHVGAIGLSRVDDNDFGPHQTITCEGGCGPLPVSGGARRRLAPERGRFRPPRHPRRSA